MPAPVCSSPWSLLLLAVVLLPGCQTAPPSPVPVPPAAQAQALSHAAYQCGDTRIEIVDRDEQLLLRLPRGDMPLRREVAASGARYADRHGNRFWSRGEEAMLVMDGGEQQSCSPVAARSPWAQARDRGVVIRAVGQEPGWLADIFGGDEPKMQLQLDYGQRTLTVDRARGQGNPDQQRFAYTGETDGERVHLEFRRASCRDNMSGHHFPLRAELTVGGRQLWGCAHHWPVD